MSNHSLTLFDGTEVNLKLITFIEPIVKDGTGENYTIHFMGGSELTIFESKQYLRPNDQEMPVKQYPRAELIKKWIEADNFNENITVLTGVSTNDVEAEKVVNNISQGLKKCI